MLLGTDSQVPSALLAQLSFLHVLVHAPPHLRPSVAKPLAVIASSQQCSVKSPEHDSDADGIYDAGMVWRRVHIFRSSFSF